MIVDVIAPAPTVVDVLEPAPNVVEVSYVRGLTGATGPQGPEGPQGQKGSGGGKGEKGDTGSSGVVSVTAPITNTGTSTAANIGIDQSGLTLAQSQITNLLTDLGAKANLANPTFTGILRAPLIAGAEGGKAAIRPNLDTGGIGIETNGSANKGLVVRGAGSQSADLQQWQIDNATVRAKVGASGRVAIGSPATEFNAAWLSVSSVFNTSPGIVVRGVASQSANLQQWQNSAGTSLASVTAAGEIYSSNALRSPVLYTGSYLFIASEENSGGKLRMRKTTAQVSSPGANLGAIYFRDGTNAGTLKLVVRAGAAGAETTILDNIPQ